jgi:predicted nuclease of predicted toxin-antitoxin system
MSDLRFLLDENVPRPVMRFLKSKQYHVEYVPKGAKNSRVAQLARERKAILLTRDSDFANTLAYPPRMFYGIVVLQIHPPRSELLAEALSNFLTKVDEFEGKLFLVERFGLNVTE